MDLDHNAIYKAYSGTVISINDAVGALDANGDVVSIEQSKVDAARIELNKLKYQQDRKREYPDWGTQLDYIYHNGIDKWKTDIVDPIKNKYPKPS